MNTADLDKVDLLKGLELAATSGNSFARSLLTGYKKYHSFTSNQMPHAQRCAKQALGLVPAQAQGESLGAEFVTLVERFNIAKSNKLKRPSLAFWDIAGYSKIKIYMAADTSRNPGYLYLQGNGEYLGKISPSGIFSKARECNAEIVDFLKKLTGESFATFTAHHGRETGNCCFCSLLLTDNRSVTAGYGPICAGKWSLPWG